MKVLIIILVSAEFLLTIYTYMQIRDICGHINDTLIMQDIEIAKLYYKIGCDVATNTELNKSGNNSLQENKKKSVDKL